MKSSNEIKSEERLGRIYASEESLKEHVQAMEMRFVRSFKETDRMDSPGQLESNLEWFLDMASKARRPANDNVV